MEIGEGRKRRRREGGEEKERGDFAL